MTDTEITRFLAEKLFGCGIHVERMSREHEELFVRKDAPRAFTVFDSGGIAMCGDLPNDLAGRYFDPLSSISDAFQVMEKMGGMWLGPASNGHGWIAAKLSLADYGDEDSPATKYAETAARAICLAAIAALEGK